jgi:hypothetical protein
VTATKEISPRDSSSARAASDGEHQHQQSDNGAHGDDDQGENDQQQPGCDASLLTAGRVVKEAEADATGGGLKWHKIEIVR